MEIINKESITLLIYFISRKNYEFYKTNLRFSSISGFSITELGNIQSNIFFFIALIILKYKLISKIHSIHYKPISHKYQIFLLGC
jgi:hypothetical protein